MTAVSEPEGATRSASRVFAEFVSGLTYDRIPDDVVHAAKLHALDTVGVGIAAAVLPGEAATARASTALFREVGGRPQSSMIGVAEKVPAVNAAYANGSLQHSLDFDDIHTDSRVHSSTMIVPAALAVAEREAASGEQFVAAMVAGHEVAVRVGMGGPVHFQLHGFHGTPVAGVFGAAAAASALQGADAATTADAFGIAGDAAGGLNAWIAEGTGNKHLHAGWAAHGGVISADLARLGAQGPPGVFEGTFGLYEALTGRSDADLTPVLSTLGTVWETAKSAFKAFPACYWSHGSIDAARRLRSEVQDDLDRIESIEALVRTPAVTIVLEPRETRIRPLTPYAGKFSLQYSVAAMLVHGRVDLATYTAPALQDRRVLDLAERVGYVVDPALERMPQLYAGGLRIRMRDGRELSVEVPEPPGTELNPLPDDALWEKFRSCAQYGLDADDVDDLGDAIMHVERPGAIARIGDALRRVRAER